MALLVFSVSLALGVSAMCSLLEATLLSYTTSQVSALQSKRPRVGKIWRRFKDSIEKPIAVILVTNTTAHTIGATIAGAQFESLFGEQWLVVFSIVLTYLMLQFTEILPKTLGVKYNRFLAPAIAPPLDLLVRVMRPLLWFIHLVNKPFERKSETADTTLEEIAGLAATARLSQLIDPRQAQILHAASQIESLRVRQIMTPRIDIQYLRVGQPVEELLDILRTSPYTRLPLCEGDIDHPIGMVHIRDALRQLHLAPTGPSAENPDGGVQVYGEGAIDLMQVKREILILPDHLTITEALARFQNAGTHLAIVVDEFGSTLGIVTLEDVVEELVGDIRDEFDIGMPSLIKQEGNAYRVKGRLALHDLESAVPDIGIDHTSVSVDTVGGYVSQEMKRLPRKGEGIDVGRYRWTVTAADSRRVRELLIAPIELDDTAEEKEHPQAS